MATTEKDIDDKIHRIVDEFNKKIYDGKLISGMIDRFEKALMAIPPEQHRLNMNVVKGILAKRQDELNLVEVGLVNNIIMKAVPGKMYDSVHDYIDDRILLDEIATEYNKITTSFEKQILKTRDRMVEMSGIKKSAPFNNGMNIIK